MPKKIAISENGLVVEARKTAREMNLAERVNRILQTSALELDGEAYLNNYELNNGRSIKDFILDKLRLNDKRKNIIYTNIDTGEKISISSNSAGKLAGHYKYCEAYQKTIAHIPQIIKNMKFFEKMLADKQNSKFNNYSYYITNISMDGNPYVILSTVGYNKYGIYYDQNVFKGTVYEVFTRAKNKTNDPKYSRLSEILKDTDI